MPPEPQNINKNEYNPVAGLLALAGAGFTAWYLNRMFWAALANGYSPGKMGATYPAGSPQYIVFVGACVLGLGFAAIIAWMGLKWLGLKFSK